MLSFSGQRRHSHDDDGNDAGPIDPESTESNQLIPARKRRHRVRVQGRLAVVRSVSAANLRPAVSSVAPALPSPVAAAVGGTATPAAPPKFESGVAGSAAAPARGRGMTMRSRERGRGRGRSVDDASSDAGEDDDDARETAVRDRQFRGYGIGGAGNIRRPTEVYGATSKPSSLSSRFSLFNPSGSVPVSGSGSGSAAETDRGQWSFRELFARTGERKGKGVA
ncbi:UDP-glucuronosyl UDP-glucosyltransferase [Colletotrichum higginsianum]|nr:UDP-glucuronosyl UDP-glucosyltransferase [Colletotrichum higginsianum]